MHQLHLASGAMELLDDEVKNNPIAYPSLMGILENTRDLLSLPDDVNRLMDVLDRISRASMRADPRFIPVFLVLCIVVSIVINVVRRIRKKKRRNVLIQ